MNWIAANKFRTIIARLPGRGAQSSESIHSASPVEPLPDKASAEFFNHNQRRVVRSVQRIQRITRHLDVKSYLEIGVSRGGTFKHVNVQTKVGVDPRFRFDVSEVATEGVELFPMTSDAFFTNAASSRKFDLIFLDGLHTFQQTFRDFCNSLTCAHDRTVWLIDDVIPIDVFSAWPIQREAIEYRRRINRNAIPYWHGDVFKVIFAIHDFFPTLSYVTLLGDANPQAIVWKAPRRAFKPIFNSFESIERLGYFDLLNRQEALNGIPEDEGFSRFLSSMRDTDVRTTHIGSSECTGTDST